MIAPFFQLSFLYLFIRPLSENSCFNFQLIRDKMRRKVFFGSRRLFSGLREERKAGAAGFALAFRREKGGGFHETG
jgi:hypothetical protein